MLYYPAMRAAYCTVVYNDWYLLGCASCLCLFPDKRYVYIHYGLFQQHVSVDGENNSKGNKRPQHSNRNLNTSSVWLLACFPTGHVC